MLNQPPAQAQCIAQIAQAQTGDMSQVPDEQLIKLASQPNPQNPMPQLVALSEVQKRKQARLMEQAARAKQQQQGRPQTVKDQVLGGQPVQQGPAQPPQPMDMMVPQGQPQQPQQPMMASGGVVRLYGGGEPTMYGV